MHARGAPEWSPTAKKIWLSIDLRSFGIHVTVRLSECPSTLQGNQCEIPHFFANVGACNLILHIHVVVNIIENCQNRVSVDQYHLTVSWAQVSTHGGNSFLKLSADKLLVFQLIAGSTPSGFLYNGYKFIFLVDNMSMGASPLALATSM